MGRVGRLLAVVLFGALGAGCSCDRGGALAGQQGELVVVVPAAGGEQLTRQATLTLEPVVMEEAGEGVVRLRNIGVAPLTVVSVTKQGGSDALSLDDAPGLVIPRDGEVTLTARFAPPTDADVTRPTVEHRADFRVEVTGGRAGEQLASVTLVALAVARDCYVPAQLDFGAVPLGQHVTLPLVLENGKALPASTEVSPLEGADPLAFALPSAGPFEVNPGQRVEVPVSFGPLEERAYSASLRMRRAATCPEAVTRLSGVGSNEAVSWAPAMVDFGRSQLGVQVLREVTVFNGSGAPLALEGPATDSPAFAVVNAPAVVPPHGSATVVVGCTPAALGRVTGTLRFDVATVERVSARVPLTCIGGAPRIRLSPSPALSFGAVPIGGVSARRLSVQNVGTPPPAPGDTSTNLRLGFNGALPYVAVVPTTASTSLSDFEVVVPSGYDPAVGLPALGGLNTLDLDVRLKVNSVGRREADLFVYSNDPLQPSAAVHVSASPTAPGQCALSILPGSLSMGDVPRGASFDRILTITGGSGTRDCLVAVDMAPGSATNLAVIDAAVPFVLNAGESRNVRVRATADPALPFSATARGFVRVQPGRDLPVLVPVEMRVANCLVLDPSAIDFGITKVGCRSGSRPVNAYNGCGVPLLVDSITLRPANSGFALTSTIPIPQGGLALNSGQAAATLLTAFAPTQVGLANAALDFSVREGGQARVVSVDLQGTGDPYGIQTDTWQQVGSGKLDILFVVDNSCSMADEQQSLASNFASFIAGVNTTTVDFHLGVTTTDIFRESGRLVGSPTVLTAQTPGLASAFAQNVLVGTGGSGLEQPFEAAARALTEPMKSGANAGFLRSDASLAIILVTDAVEQSPNSVPVYLSTYRQAKGGKPELVSVSVVGPFTAPGLTCQLDSTVDNGRYRDMVDRTNGVRTSICTTDWARDLSNIGMALVQPRLEYRLSSQPETPSTIQVRVNGAVVTGWTYRASDNTIVFPSASPPPAGASVTATYGTVCF